ncbi:MAG: hypothetical protein OHK0039_32100 [Bacteroidia bacterium]
MSLSDVFLTPQVSAPDCICLLDADGVICYDGGAGASGRAGIPWLALLHPDDREAARQMLERAQTTDVIHPFRIFGEGTDGKPALMVWHLRRIPAGTHTYVLGWKTTAIDRSAATELAWFHASPLPEWICTRDDLAFVAANPAALALLGYTSEELMHLCLPDLLVPDEQAMLIAPGHVPSQTGAVWGIRTLTDKQGALCTVQLAGHAISYDGRPCLRIIGQDMQAHVRVWHDLLQRDNQLEHAQQIAQLGYWRIDLRTGWLHLSPYMYDIWEQEPSSSPVAFGTFLATVHPDDRAALLAARHPVLAGQSDLDLRHRIVLPDGRVKWIQQRASLVRNADGTPAFFEGTARDITELVEVTAALQGSESQFRTLVDSIGDMVFTLDTA